MLHILVGKQVLIIVAPGPSTYELPAVDKANARQRAKGGKVGRAPRLKPIYTTAADSPGPGSYFSQSHTEVQKEVSVRRTNSRNSVAHSLSRASLGREKSLEMKGPNRKTYLDDMQRKTSKLPGPGAFLLLLMPWSKCVLSCSSPLLLYWCDYLRALTCAASG